MINEGTGGWYAGGFGQEAMFLTSSAHIFACLPMKCCAKPVHAVFRN